MIGAPFLVLGLLVTLSALTGATVAGRERGTVASILLSPLHPATWAAAAAILVGFGVELFAFLAVVGLLSSGTSLLVVGVGFVLVALGIELARMIARVERRRARWADPAPLHAHAYRPYGRGTRDLVVALLLDIARWRDVVYVLVAFPLAVLEFAAVSALWAAALVVLSLPIGYAVGELPTELLRSGLSAEGVVLLATLAGAGLTIVAAAVTRGLMTLHRAVVVGLLCVSERRALEQRVATLETSRRAVLDVEASELRRIERDLHDGAQQRLVMLSMQLGLAAERMDDDPPAAKALVVDAREQARQALAEIRELVRGIAPAILMDRGLAPALSALAGRSPVATVVASELPDGLRVPDAVERAAYFVVAEAVANTAKHAAARRCEIRCRLAGDDLVVEVEDDGAGGAIVVPGGGLAGLADRVEALDGTLTVTSPPGGPTVIRAVFGLPASGVGGPGAVPAPGRSGWVLPRQDSR